MPLFRPLLLAFQTDPAVTTLDDQFMVGDALLAAPILRPGERGREVYLPDGVWYDFWTGARIDAGFRRFDAPLDHLPLFVRGGNVIVSTESMNHVHEKPWSPLRFDVYPDATGNAIGSVYEDDGASPAYANGVFRRTGLRFSANASRVRLTLDAPTGSFQTPPRNLEFILHAAPAISTVLIDGQLLAPSDSSSSTAGWFITPSTSTVTLRLSDDGHAHTFELH
jgi:alpha-glucosidase (family GH31 glycosyl hydrolase)